MRRLFWKFFLTIWVTMTACVAIVVVTLAALQIVPFSSELQQARQSFVVGVASQILKVEGREAAERFALQSATAATPVAIDITQVESGADCASRPTSSGRYVASGADCFFIDTRAEPLSLFSLVWPRVVPWLTALVAAAIAAFWLARYLVRPVDEIRHGLSALARGRFEVRIGREIAGRRDEVAALAHDFNTSAARLEEFQNLQQRLFHDVSHELRSPLSRLQAAMGVLQQNPGKLHSMMERMLREIERIDGLVGEILTFARLADRNATVLTVQTLDVIDLLTDIVDDATFEGHARRITVNYEGVRTFVAPVNGELIYRGLENVIRNAVKYASEGSAVTVRSSVADDLLSITVADTGPGVPTDKLEGIFQPFSRGDNADSQEGYGLGLAIAKQAVERHGGHICAMNSASGGFVVEISVPKSREFI
jgi:two-component system, OmpR family, sensor kinase